MAINYNVFDILDRTALSGDRGRVAVVCDGESRTFDELRTRSLRLANGLKEAGLGPGSKVAVLMGNGHEWPEAFFALAALGATCVPVNVLLKGPEVRHVLTDSDVDAMIVDETAERAIDDLDDLPGTLITAGSPKISKTRETLDYELLIDRAVAEWPGRRPGPTDVFIHYYTSGTTGLPKAAVHTHGGVVWNSYHQIADLGLRRDDTYLCIPSLSWAAGFHDVLLALMMIGGRNVIMPTGATGIENIVDTIRGQSVNRTFMVPTLLRQLSSSPDLLAKARESKLEWIITGSEPVPPDTIERLNSELPDCGVVQGYGLSEFPTVGTVLEPHEAISHAGKAGRPTSTTTMAVMTSTGEIAPSGEGEILLRNPATMQGYLNRPEETAEALAHDWLHTGDLGTIDDDGYLTVTGRKKDMIISGGLNVYPREIEDVIHEIEGVREVAVVGLEDDRWGEIPAAVVVCAEGAVDTDVIDSTCRSHLATFKCPKEIFLREEPLPRNPSGKIVKRDVRPWVTEQLQNLS